MIDLTHARALAIIRGRLTPSKANLVAACPPSVALPWMRSSSSWSGLGDVIHRYLELLQRYRNGELVALDEWGERIPPEALERLARVVRAQMPAEHRLALEAIDLNRLPLDPGLYRVSEVFAYNWVRDTGRRLEVPKHRSYEGLFDPAEEIPGTLDVRGDTGPNDPRGQAVVVIDYKLWAPDSPPLRDDLQLLLYALAATRALGYERALLAKIRIRDGSPRWEWEELEAWDLDAAAARVKKLMGRVLELAPRVAAGDTSQEVLEAYSHGTHCTHCPAVRVCPAKMLMVGQVVRATRPGQANLLPFELGPENQEQVYKTLTAASALLEQLWGDFDAYARQAAAAGHPVQAGNGYVYAPQVQEREVWDPLDGALVLAQAFDAETARRAIRREPEMLATTIEDAVDDLLERAKRDPLLAAKVREQLPEGQRPTKRAVLDVVRALLKAKGASAVRVGYPVTRHKAPLAADAPRLRTPREDVEGLVRLVNGVE